MGLQHATFQDLIAANKRNSALLVILFCIFVTVVAFVLGIGILAATDPNGLSALDLTEGLVIGAIGAGVSFAISLIAYYAGDNLVLAMGGAKPIQHQDDPELFNVVEELAIAAGVPMPAVYLIPDQALNAFATGRDPKHAAVAITTGLRKMLTRDELQGVLAHEMSHIRNYDTRLMLLMAVLVGTIVMLCDFFMRSLWWAPMGRDRRKRDSKDGGGGVLALILILVAVVLAIVAPLLAQIIQLAVSRQREFLADASAVQLTRYPQGLANALRKLRDDPHELQHANRGTAHLYIANPIKKFEAKGSTMFASHPPLDERIRRLEALVH